MPATLPRTLATAALAVALGWCAFIALRFERQREELARVTRENGLRLAALRDVRVAAAAAIKRAAAAQAALPAAQAGPAAPADLKHEILGWLDRSRRLKQLATERSDLRFPEVETLSDNQWFNAAKEAKLDTDEEVRATLRSLRETARNSLAHVLQAALTGYADAHEQRLPAGAQDLAPFTEGRASAALLSRYDILQQGDLLSVELDVPIMAERPGLSPAIDNRVVVTTRESSVDDLDSVPDRELRRALRAYRAANGSQDPRAAAQLVNYFQTPLRPAALRSFLDRPASDFSAEALRKLLPPE